MKVVFIINMITIPRCLKRVEEFVKQGCDVEVFGFDRGQNSVNKNTSFDINIIGKHTLQDSYFKRLFIILRSIIPVIWRYRKSNVLYYFFFFDVASLASLMTRKDYIYEESDMPYADMQNGIIRNICRIWDRIIIKRSKYTVMTSEGFAKYHFGDSCPVNIHFIPNKVNKSLLNEDVKTKSFDINHIKFSFIGGVRYAETIVFGEVIAKYYPQHEFHIYGNISNHQKECEQLEQYPNVFVHGVFKNPKDLPSIYYDTDIVLAAYDAKSVNAQYAEPNKLYEAMFFETPIVVSRGTYLSEKVGQLGIGYSVDSMDVEDIRTFIDNITLEDIHQKIINLKKISKTDVVDDNSDFIRTLYLER